MEKTRYIQKIPGATLYEYYLNSEVTALSSQPNYEMLGYVDDQTPSTSTGFRGSSGHPESIVLSHYPPYEESSIHTLRTDNNTNSSSQPSYQILGYVDDTTVCDSIDTESEAVVCLNVH